MSALILIKGELEVTADGYWYTSGGEKSSFGYYPHLTRMQDGKRLPVFPDTQIHGDLRMAAGWLANREEKFNKPLVERVFGKEGSRMPSIFSISDLELAEASRKEWSTSRFAVKPRSEIDDNTRTNKDKMLAFQELSYLKGIKLHGDFCMGYFKNKAEADQALALLKESLQLLGGFGASRSRGYSRGSLKIEKMETIIAIAPDSFTPSKSRRFRYTVTPLVNFRNKPVNPAGTQLIRSEKVISERQMKAWFANAFHDLYEDWPSPQQTSTIRFSSFYPALEKSPAYPPPFSTVQFEDDSMKDSYGDERKDDDPDEQENLVRSKAKPPGEGTFLTNEETPSAFRVKAEKRFRNSMDEKFVTLETGGLFAQEFIRAGQPFCGTVAFEGNDADFESKALFLLENTYPKINGAFFKPDLLAEQGTTTGKNDLPFVLTEPVEYSLERFEKGVQIKLNSLRGYNTTLRRPRRNRIVFSPGSLMSKSFDERAIVWKGLTKTVDATLLQKATQASVTPSELPKPDEAIGKMSRAQAGNLRRFLEMTPELAKNRIESLLKKYEDWKKETVSQHLIPQAYLEKAKQLLDGGMTDDFRQYMQGLLQQYAVALWDKKSKKIAEEAKQQGGVHGITE